VANVIAHKDINFETIIKYSIGKYSAYEVILDTKLRHWENK